MSQYDWSRAERARPRAHSGECRICRFNNAIENLENPGWTCLKPLHTVKSNEPDDRQSSRSNIVLASSVMTALALLALMFGFGGMMLLDGQVFTHAVVGIVCGFVAAVCGVILARRGREPRWVGWSFAVLGLALTIWCGIESPSAYRFQQKFNNRSREHREKLDRQNQTPDPAWLGR